MALKKLILMGLVAVCAGMPALAQEPVTKAYGVGFLTRMIPDSPGPILGFASRVGSTEVLEEQEDLAPILINRISDNIDPGSWKKPHYIRLRGSTLLIHARPATQAKIRRLLARSRAMHARPVQLQVVVYSGPAAALDKLLSGGPLLSTKALTSLTRAPWRRVRSARLSAFSGRRIHLASSRRVSYLLDFEVEVATESGIADPEIGRLVLGRVDDLRPTLSADGKALLVECRIHSAESAKKMPIFVTGIEVHNLKPGGGGQFTALDQPSVWQRSIHCTVYLPAGGASVIGTQPGVQGRTEVLVLRHHARAQAHLPAPPKSNSKRRLKIIDVRFATYQGPDFSAPDLRPLEPTRVAVPAAITFSSEAEEGVQWTPEELVEMIQSSVDEDSWHNTRNRISLQFGRLLVQQTPGTLAKIAALTADLERARQVSVMVRTRFISVTGKQDWFLEHSGGSLDAAGLEALRKKLAEAEDVTELAGLTITGLPQQQVSASSYREAPYVADYDVEIAEKASAMDPEVKRFKTGAVLHVRSVLVGSSNRVLVELRASLAELIKMRVVNVTPKIRLQLPEIRLSSRRTSLLMSHGGSYLLALSSGRYLLVQVQLSRTSEKKK